MACGRTLAIPVMQHRLLSSLVLLALSVGATLAAGRIGDPAAPLIVKDWVHGDPVDLSAGKGKQVYVVEFWATWCGPCRTSIPHLTELQKKFRDKGVTLIGVSDEDADTVKPFLKKMGEKMAYTVAADPERTTYAAYMQAYGQNGIPTAFVVDREGRVAWVGHPMDGLEETLEKVVAGTYDLAAAQAEHDGRAEREKRMVELNRLLGAYVDLREGGKVEEASPAAEKLLEAAGKDSTVLNAIAWTILTSQRLKNRDVAFALKVAEAANDASGGTSANVLDTYARALFDNGRKADAVAALTKAIAATPSEELKGELTKTLKAYEAGRLP